MIKDIRTLAGMTKRNVMIYLKDKTTVFFSMLGPLIILGLYLLFLKQNYVEIINDALIGLENIVSQDHVDALINSWLIAGIMATSCITVSLNSLTVMVNDKERKIDYDYKATPAKGFIVVLSYFFGAFICSLIITGTVLVVSLIYLALSSSLFLSILGVIKVIIILILGSLSATIIMMLIALFFKKSSAMGAFGGIVTAAIGFLIGAYIPISQFSDGVQIFANILPGSHIASLFRSELMTPVLEEINISLNGIDNGQFASSMIEVFSLKLNFFGKTIDKPVMYSYILIMTVIILGINIFLYRYSSKRK